MKRFIPSAVLIALIMVILCGICFAQSTPVTSSMFDSSEMSADFDDDGSSDSDREAEYHEALRLLYSREFDDSRKKFLALGDYLDSAERAEFCLSYPESDQSGDTGRYGSMLSPYWHYKDFDKGTLYCAYSICIRGYWYVPNEINEDTKWLLYFCGGVGEDYLYYYGVIQYLREYEPNAVIMFSNESGYCHISDFVETQYRLLQQIAKELGTVVHDIYLSGSSNGCFTALHAAAQLHSDFNQRCVNVVTLDTGMEWDSPYNLTDEEIEIIASAGTEIYLFEQADTGMDRPAIAAMVNAGIPVWIVACKSNQHSQMSVDAYTYGVFSWACGEHVSLPDWNYTYIKLKPGMTDNGEVIWAEN